ncbi:MAG: glutathione S-transferase family protein [Polyangiaceae bacterium]|nr:glutathione S-transferase family protein [Polyangiaceae bacterium]
MEPIRFVDLETARAAPGMRLVVAANLPSPWSEAAKGILRMKEIPFVAVRLGPGDGEVRKWTRSRNAPAAMFDDEPARTGWADILELAERVGTGRSLVPSSPSDRVRMFGLSHEIMGEGGMLWSGRVLTVDAGLTSGGSRGFPEPIASYLGARYGYSKERLALARARVGEGWKLVADALGDKTYFFGDEPTALDVYLAASLNVFAPLPESVCPMWAPVRAAFESMRDELGDLPTAILRHRDRMYERHLGLPIVT